MNVSLLIAVPAVLRHCRVYGVLRQCSLRCFSTLVLRKNLLDCCKLLELPEQLSSSPEEVKEAYLRLAKKYHPDSGSASCDPIKFNQIEEAYRTVLSYLAEKKRKEASASRGDEEDEEEEKRERHSPQHRQYLTFEGVGIGTPSQRERQYRQFQVDRASDQVLEYRKRTLEAQTAGNELIASDLRRSKKIKITQAIERLVEDLIQESMAKGDFSNLSGKGKPLTKFGNNPYIDPMTHNLNRILIDNGYQPQWILAQKEIRETIGKLRAELLASRRKIGEPLNASRQRQWQVTCEEFAKDLASLNKKVNDFNLVVPLLSRQMVHFNVEREMGRVSCSYEELRRIEQRERPPEDESEEDTNQRGGLLKWMRDLLK
ncbi:dnaJ homolog subfamily C member 28 [Erpetoichthys calabaricus]|uniref:DnaJ (Hsp40) homolog, subfamily C, member 28 n=1 Tax=Erpetoichthys calabaricus TaxID=27687 RepID=A0A8C4T056_ERPCA|nr:dnaJ homolog subfamily C member 28 [Erpetoichthys calabaricus]